MSSVIVHGESLHQLKLKNNLELIFIVKDTGDDVFGWLDLRQYIGASGKLLHQLLKAFVVALLAEVWSQILRELGPVAKLGCCQCIRCSWANAIESDLLMWLWTSWSCFSWVSLCAFTILVTALMAGVSVLNYSWSPMINKINRCISKKVNQLKECRGDILTNDCIVGLS